MAAQKQQIIIFEGPDGCGKTNISLALSDSLGIPYFKNTAEWDFFENDPSYFKNCLTYGAPFLLSYLEQSGVSLIEDRGHPSEWVYSRVFNRETDEHILKLVDQKYAELGAKIIVPVRSDYSAVVDQFEVVDVKKLNKIHDAYTEFLDWTVCETLVINVDDENLEREIKEIMQFLGEE
jgi:thymidylate kinase